MVATIYVHVLSEGEATIIRTCQINGSWGFIGISFLPLILMGINGDSIEKESTFPKKHACHWYPISFITPQCMFCWSMFSSLPDFNLGLSRVLLLNAWNGDMQKADVSYEKKIFSYHFPYWFNRPLLCHPQGDFLTRDFQSLTSGEISRAVHLNRSSRYYVFDWYHILSFIRSFKDNHQSLLESW